MHYFFDTTWILLLYCSMLLFTPWMWPFYRCHFPIATICANLQFLLATLTYVFCSNCMHVYRLSKCVLFCMCMYMSESFRMSLSWCCRPVTLCGASGLSIKQKTPLLTMTTCGMCSVCCSWYARTHTHARTHARTHLNLYACIWDTNNEVRTSIHVHCWVCWIFKYVYFWLCRYSRIRMTEYRKHLLCLENS